MCLHEVTHGGETSRSVAIDIADDDGEASQQTEESLRERRVVEGAECAEEHRVRQQQQQ